jgi:putative Holliday junction resolvase
MARTLGLDIGNRRIGVAVSDASKLIARPLCVIDRKHEDASARLKALFAEYEPDEIVIGYPYRADGGVGEQAARVDAFVAELRALTQIPLTRFDERFSTAEAREIIAGKKRTRQPEHDDAVAAAVILQRCLDERRAGDVFDEAPE